MTDAEGLPWGFAVMTPPKLDFRSDWHGIARDWLTGLGVDLSDATTPVRLGIRYYEVRWRLIQPPRRRRVLFADGLRARFPEPLRPALDEFVWKAETGEDLMPHTSRRPVLKPYSADGLLFDWGLHHFHLGRTPDARDPRFMERTSEVLLAHVTRDELYVVDLREHGRDAPPPWAIKEIYEAVRVSFPELMRPTGLRAAGPDISPKERMDARKNLVLPLELGDGKVYMPLGGGASTAGTSTRAADRYGDMLYRLNDWERTVWRNLERLRAMLPPGAEFGTPPEFRLVFKDHMFHALETTAGKSFPLS